MIQRERYMQEIRDFMDKPVVKIITGMRRCGKSTLLELTREELRRRGVQEQNIISMNFESLRYEAFKDYRALYQEVCKRADRAQGKVYILLDEIQEVDSWEQVINSLRVDLDCDIYVTGSNAKLLSGELATLLAGRYVEIRVYPLDFREYLDFAAENPEEASLSQQEQFANFLRFGGLPGIHQMKWEETRVMQYLHDIYNSVLLKDVIARNKIRDTALLESVIAYLMDNIGNTFSAKTITDFLKNQGRKLSAETVYNYLWRALFSFIKRCALTSKGNVFWKRRRSIISLTLVCAMQLSDTVTTILLGFWKALCIWSFFAVAGRFISESKMWQKWILSRIGQTSDFTFRCAMYSPRKTQSVNSAP